MKSTADRTADELMRITQVFLQNEYSDCFSDKGMKISRNKFSLSLIRKKAMYLSIPFGSNRVTDNTK